MAKSSPVIDLKRGRTAISLACTLGGTQGTQRKNRTDAFYAIVNQSSERDKKLPKEIDLQGIFDVLYVRGDVRIQLNLRQKEEEEEEEDVKIQVDDIKAQVDLHTAKLETPTNIPSPRKVFRGPMTMRKAFQQTISMEFGCYFCSRPGILVIPPKSQLGVS